MKIVLIIIIITIILFMIIKLFCYEIRKRKFKNKDVSVKRHVIRILDQKPQYIYLS
jgi:hypothetical protein